MIQIPRSYTTKPTIAGISRDEGGLKSKHIGGNAPRGADKPIPVGRDDNLARVDVCDSI